MRLSLSMTGALIGLGLLASALPAAAAPVSSAMSKILIPANSWTGDNATVIEVQNRRRGRGGARNAGRGGARNARRGGGRNARRGGGGRRGGGNNDGAIAAGILGGLFLGAIIANESQRSRDVEYCIQKYRSYDPRSGTYLGYDGYRHACP